MFCRQKYKKMYNIKNIKKAFKEKNINLFDFFTNFSVKN